MRSDDRTSGILRPFSIEPGYIGQALGSALVASGRTRVICTASKDAKPPRWLPRGGWVTAEYAMLPGSTGEERGRRDPGGRGKEIQRLIGRSLRAAVDLSKLEGPDGGIHIVCDCDVIEADGGTRTAAITGAYVALAIALHRLRGRGVLSNDVVRGPVAAVSVGIVRPVGSPPGAPPVPMLDLCYEEDSRAVVDLNVVMRKETPSPRLVELQGTGEDGTFDRQQLDQMLDLAETGIRTLFDVQAAAIARACSV